MKDKKSAIAIIALLVISIPLAFLISEQGFEVKPLEEIENTTPLKSSNEFYSAIVTDLPSKSLDFDEDLTLEENPFLGSNDAKVTMIEFSDYECEHCKNYFDHAYKLIKSDYIDTNKIKYITLDFPLESHPLALIAAGSANCAYEQNKFWEMHDLLFEKQLEWQVSMNPSENFKQYAKDVGMNVENFTSCLEANRYESAIAQDIHDGIEASVTATPTFFINGKKVMGAQDYKIFQAIIENASREES